MMCILAQLVITLLPALTIVGVAAGVILWAIKTTEGKMAVMAIFMFVAFVAASGILG